MAFDTCGLHRRRALRAPLVSEVYVEIPLRLGLGAEDEAVPPPISGWSFMIKLASAKGCVCVSPGVICVDPF